MKWIKYHNNTLLFWFRIFGWGLCFRKKKNAGFRYTFSERNGHTKYLETPWHVITVLRPNKS